jgi:two-component system NarL family response regulator
VNATGSPKIKPRDQIRLLIADDHALILEGLAATIARQEDMTVVATASDGREAADLWKQHRPDISLLDLRMPKLNGVGVINEVRAADSSARIIVHTTYDTDEEIYQAVRAGAKGYLLKDAPLEELLGVSGRCIPARRASRRRSAPSSRRA